MPPIPTFRTERRLLAAGFTHIAGVDEVGRGPLAGPVVAAACVLDPARIPAGLRDSKLLTAIARERLEKRIRETALAWACAKGSAGTIDAIGIVDATKRAMRLAVRKLGIAPGFLLVDAIALNVPGIPQLAIIHGDARVSSIAAASILAKVHRDRIMRRWDTIHPGYGFAAHVGYGTPAHLEALERLGPSPIHRISFAPLA